MDWLFWPSVIVAFGVFHYVLSLGSARETEADARRTEAEARLLEAENEAERLRDRSEGQIG